MGVEGQVSRTGLGPEVVAAIAEFLAEVDRTFRRSRAGLERSLFRNMVASAGKSAATCSSLGQAGP